MAPDFDALPPDEREQFEEHLSRCPDCHAEAEELLAAAAHLGQASAVVPPAALRQQVLAEVARTRQVPPGDPVPLEARRRPRWVAPVLAAAGLLVVLAIAAVAIGQDHRADDAEQLAAITAASDAQTVEVSGADLPEIRDRVKQVFITSAKAAEQDLDVVIVEPDHQEPE